MEKISTVKALNDYFNTDSDGKRIKPISEFNAELKALSPEEKRELAEGAAAAMGKALA